MIGSLLRIVWKHRFARMSSTGLWRITRQRRTELLWPGESLFSLRTEWISQIRRMKLLLVRLDIFPSHRLTRGVQLQMITSGASEMLPREESSHNDVLSHSSSPSCRRQDPCYLIAPWDLRLFIESSSPQPSSLVDLLRFKELQQWEGQDFHSHLSDKPYQGWSHSEFFCVWSTRQEPANIPITSWWHSHPFTPYKSSWSLPLSPLRLGGDLDGHLSFSLKFHSITHI